MLNLTFRLSIDDNTNYHYMITLNRFFKNEVEEAETIQKMFKFGGSFVKALAEAYECADPINKGKLLIAFTNYFDEYKKNFNDN